VEATPIEAEKAMSRGWDRSGERPTTLLLVRHGSTIHSLSGRFSGRNDLPLDEPGVVQAKAIAGYIDLLDPVDAILSSPLRRARETADAIAAPTGRTVEINDDLVELDFGQWEGLSFAEAKRAWPADLVNWLDSEQVAPPGGESFATVTQRVRRLLGHVLASYPGQRVVMVSHLTPIKTLLRLALGAPHEAVFRFHLDTGALSIIDYYGDGACSVRMLNRSEHRH
jgi:ribonuclease H / adenosylcobalamin/alpha-ribazole phosphatase